MKRAIHLEDAERDLIFDCLSWCAAKTEMVRDGASYDTYAKLAGRISRKAIGRVLVKFANEKETPK